MTQQSFSSFLESREVLYLDLLRHMVHINSFTTNRDGINALGDLTAVSFERLGFSAESVPAHDDEHGDHLILTRQAAAGDGRAPSVALISHLDTVFPPEEERRHGFSWREDGERIYGPGTVDIKGGTVVAYMLLDALQAVAPEIYDAVTWKVLLNCAEEVLAKDFGHLCLERLDPERTLGCLVFEEGHVDDAECWLVGARKGRAVFRVTVSGRGGHAGTNHRRGVNALVQLAEVIRQIAGWTDYARELTFNVGVAEGGTVVNRIPHAASALVEMRAFDPQVFAGGMRRMQELETLSSVVSPEDGYGSVVRVETLSETAPWPRNPRTDALLEIWGEAARSTGRQVVPEHRGGLSDANFLWHTLPTLDGLGAAGDNAHSSEHSADGSKEQEYVVRSSLVAKAALNAHAVVRLVESRAG